KEGGNVQDRRGVKDGLVAPRRRDPREPIDSMIRRHDRAGVDSPRTDDPKPELALGPPLAGTRQIGCEIALKALLRERAAVAKQAQAELAIGDDRATARRVTLTTGERSRDRVLRARHADRRAHRAAGGDERRGESHPKTSPVIVRNQASASTASALRASRGASDGLTPPAPGTSASCPLVGC